MNIKITISLILIALVIGVVVYINPFKSEEVFVEESPWFYQVAKEDIIGVKITNKDSIVKLDEFSDKTKKIRVTDNLGKVLWVEPTQVSASFL